MAQFVFSRMFKTGHYMHRVIIFPTYAPPDPQGYSPSSLPTSVPNWFWVTANPTLRLQARQWESLCLGTGVEYGLCKSKPYCLLFRE